ncbi:hypothetical protein M2H12_22830 [Vibrio vulnificus]|nr:hypothetical protein [Vibrio vulnificus]MCU8173096.1 hypothetical protein [Vibrio vulnificus]
MIFVVKVACGNLV